MQAVTSKFRNTLYGLGILLSAGYVAVFILAVISALAGGLAVFIACDVYQAC